MYQPYPGGSESQTPEPSSRPPIPQSVTRAVQVMYAGAAASIIGIIVDMTTLSSTKAQIIKRDPTWTTTQVNNAEHAAIGIFIVSGLIGAALWVWMAQANKAGKGWARIVSTVLFAIETISVLAGAAAVASGGAARIYGIVVWLIGLAAVILLWQRQSTAYFKSSSAPRY
jgi:hypothetical protein